MIELSPREFLVLEGTSKQGKPYCFLKLEQNTRNNKQLIEQVKAAGGVVIKDGKRADRQTEQSA